MKRFGARAAICLSAMIWDAVAHADTYVVGVGQSSCGSFTAVSGNTRPGVMKKMDTREGAFVSENAQYQEWLLGFISGFNEAHYGDKQKQIVANVDMAAIDLRMRNWCNKHPTQKVYDGAIAFILEMKGNAAAAKR